MYWTKWDAVITMSAGWFVHHS